VSANGYIKTFWTALTTWISTKGVLREVRWYELDDTAPHKARFSETIAVTSGAGSSAAAVLPPQVACSVTTRVLSRKHWGRFYVPCLTVNSLDANGFYTTAFVDAAATAGAVLHGTTHAAPYTCVWKPGLGVGERPSTITVDSITDTIRRRRYSTRTYQKKVDVV
jgi:hypothetical protein